MTKRIATLVVCLLSFSIYGRAQTSLKKDSLLKELSTVNNDTAKALLYIGIGNEYEMDDPQSAAHYYLLAGELSKRIHYKLGMVKFISNYTGILNQQSKFDSSLLLNKQAIQFAKELNDPLLLGKCYGNTGNVFQYTNEYDSALYYYETARKYFEQQDQPLLVARMYDLMQNTYRELRQHDKALELSIQAVNVLRGTNDSLYFATALANMGSNYSYTNQDSALKYYNEALAIATALNSIYTELGCQVNIGNIYLHQYNADKMKPHFERALQLSRLIDNAEGESIASRGIAHYFLYKKDLAQAKKFITRSLAISDSLNLQKEKFENLKSLSSILYAQQDYITAEKYLDSASAIERELNGEDIRQQTIAIEKKFETEKKEAQIKLQQSQLRQKTTFNYVLVSGAAVLLIITLLSYRNYRNRRKLQQVRIDELENEKQLAAIEAVLKGEEQERKRLAKDLHDGLGGMLSGIKHSFSNMKGNLILTPDNARSFERSIDMLDSSIQEMRRVAHNLMPEILVKYGLDTALREFCYEIERSGVTHISYQPIGMNDAAVEQSVALSIYRIVQELVNNSIRHAAAKSILVQAHLMEQDHKLMITVEDDGKGFETASLQHSTGIGWSNIKNRMAFLKGKTDIISEPGKGTSVMLEVQL